MASRKRPTFGEEYLRDLYARCDFSERALTIASATQRIAAENPDRVVIGFGTDATPIGLLLVQTNTALASMIVPAMGTLFLTHNSHGPLVGHEFWPNGNYGGNLIVWEVILRR